MTCLAVVKGFERFVSHKCNEQSEQRILLTFLRQCCKSGGVTSVFSDSHWCDCLFP